MIKNAPLFIFSNGNLAAVNKTTGDIIWLKNKKSLQLNSSSASYAVAQIHYENEKLYISVSGVILCVDATNGNLIWKNDLKGWGYSFVSMSLGDSSNEHATNSHTADAAAVAMQAAAIVAAM